MFLFLAIVGLFLSLGMFATSASFAIIDGLEDRFSSLPFVGIFISVPLGVVCFVAGLKILKQRQQEQRQQSTKDGSRWRFWKHWGRNNNLAYGNTIGGPRYEELELQDLAYGVGPALMEAWEGNGGLTRLNPAQVSRFREECEDFA
ncbi:hypothetical protein B0O99DRAFT_591307 [Bisporella sp. PMI_857]|nr:hypothetical protein B0O99DRAFT_591307 [Bisporella sp. PMI_857]